jgi:hypothetical protein
LPGKLKQRVPEIDAENSRSEATEGEFGHHLGDSQCMRSYRVSLPIEKTLTLLRQKGIDARAGPFVDSIA